MTQAPDRSVVTADGRTLIFSDGLCFEERIAESRTSRMMFLAFLKQAENMLRRQTPGFKPVKNLADPSVVEAFETVAANEAEARLPTRRAKLTSHGWGIFARMRRSIVIVWCLPKKSQKVLSTMTKRRMRSLIHPKQCNAS